MKILSQEAVRTMYSDRRLKKLSLRFAKLIKKRYPYIQLYLDFENEMKLPMLVIGVPDSLEIKDMKKFSGEIGNLLEEAGNLAEIGQLFLLAVERIGTVEARRV